MKMRKMAAAVFDRLFKNRAYTVRRGLAKGLKRKGGLGFLPVSIRRDADIVKEERFLRSLRLDGKIVYDVGGDQGIHTLFFASHVGPRGRAITFEPNPESYRRIVANVRLNGFRNVDVRPIGLGKEKDELWLVVPDGEPSRGSADPAIQELVLREKDRHTLAIEINSLDDEIASVGLPPPDFVKIDVEGLELDVLTGMQKTIAQHHPDLFIEMHGADRQRKEANAREVVRLLLDAGYSIAHLESGRAITSSDGAAGTGHLYCTTGGSAISAPVG